MRKKGTISANPTEEDRGGHWYTFLATPLGFRSGFFSNYIHGRDLFISTSSRMVVKCLKDIDSTFERLDGVGAGIIDKGELKLLFEEIKFSVTEQQFEEIVVLVDDDNDGLIAYTDFAKWYLGANERLDNVIRTVS